MTNRDSFIKPLATSFVAATSMLAGEPPAKPSPPLIPPALSANRQRDRILGLMLKLYDTHREDYEKALGMVNVHPKQKFHTEKTEIHAALTDEAEIKEVCAAMRVPASRVKKVLVKGDGLVTDYHFLTEKGEVYATAASMPFVDERTPADRKMTARGIFWTAYVPGEKRLLFGYKEQHAADGSLAKSNVIEIRHDPSKRLFSTAHINGTTSVTTPLGDHSLAEVEQNSGSKNGSSPAR